MSGSNETTGEQVRWDDDMLVLERGPEGVRMGGGLHRDERVTSRGESLAHMGYTAVGVPVQRTFGTENIVV